MTQRLGAPTGATTSLSLHLGLPQSMVAPGGQISWWLRAPGTSVPVTQPQKLYNTTLHA